MHRTLTHRTLLRPLLATVVSLGAFGGCSPPALRVEFKAPEITIPDFFGSSQPSSEAADSGSAVGVSGSDAAMRVDARGGAIIGAEYSLDTWSVEEIKARLQRNQREFDRVVGQRTELAKGQWESSARADVLEFFDSEELRVIQRLNLECMQLFGLLDAHYVRSKLNGRVGELEADLTRMERDGVDARGQTRLRKKLEELQLQRRVAGQVMIAGSMGSPPLGNSRASVTPIAYGERVEGSFLTDGRWDEFYGVSKDIGVRGLDKGYAGGRLAALLLWPSGNPGGAFRLGDVLKPDARQRVLVGQAQEAAKYYSELKAGARSEQKAYFGDCMELCKQIERCASGGDYRGVDSARASWLKMALGGLLEPMAESPGAESKAPRDLGQPATPVSAAPSQSVGAQPAVDAPDSGAAIGAGDGGTVHGMGFQDYKDGVAMVVDLDALSASFLESRRAAAQNRYLELAAVHPTTPESAQEMRSMFFHDQLAQDLLGCLRQRETDRTELQQKRREIDGRGGLGVKLPEHLRKVAERVEKQLSDRRFFTLWRTCNAFSRESFPTGLVLGDPVMGDSTRRTAGRGELEQIWGAELRCLFGPTGGAGVRPLTALASQYGDAAVRLKADSEGLVSWLVGESRFYERIVRDIDTLRTKKEATETSQYREAARRIDAELRARCESMFVDFFEPIPGVSNP